MDAEWITLTYEGVDGLMRDLRVLGAGNATTDRPRGLTGRNRLAAMRAAYERFRADGRLPATYEVVYGHAWAPLQRRGASGEVLVPPEQLRRR
jgi:malonyl-CoA O-methyltransferase